MIHSFKLSNGSQKHPVISPDPSEVGHQHLIELKAGLEHDHLPPTNEETLVQKELAWGHRTGQWQSRSRRQPCVLIPQGGHRVVPWVSCSVQFSSVRWLSHVRLFETPWTAAHPASLSITNSRRLPKIMSTESVMPSNHLISLSSHLPARLQPAKSLPIRAHLMEAMPISRPSSSLRCTWAAWGYTAIMPASDNRAWSIV